MLDDLGEAMYLATVIWTDDSDYSDGSPVLKVFRFPDEEGGPLVDETYNDTGEDRVLELGNPPPGREIIVAPPPSKPACDEVTTP
jgi:hypothetical protein